MKGLNDEFNAIDVLGRKLCYLGKNFFGKGVYFEMVECGKGGNFFDV